jgi:putative component of membrane protein insertase Oxa1/YidC/SpoIIIJ protein YidD
MNTLTAMALAAIRFYQRFLSPYKGFTCAYHAHTGCASCSALGLRAIRRYGVKDGIGVLQMRLYRCGVAYRRFAVVAPLRSKQAGFCELVELGGAAAQTVGELTCLACDFASTDAAKKKAEDEEKIHLPNRLPPLSIHDDEKPPTKDGW